MCLPMSQVLIYMKVCCLFQVTVTLCVTTKLILSSSAHLQSTAPCLSDNDLSKLVCISPLYKTLQEILHSLQSIATVEPSQHLHNGTDS